MVTENEGKVQWVSTDSLPGDDIGVHRGPPGCAVGRGDLVS